MSTGPYHPFNLDPSPHPSQFMDYYRESERLHSRIAELESRPAARESDTVRMTLDLAAANEAVRVLGEACKAHGRYLKNQHDGEAINDVIRTLADVLDNPIAAAAVKEKA